MGSHAIQPVTVSAFWGQVRLGFGPAEAAVIVGVSLGAARKWLTDAGGVKPRVHEPKTDGPRPRLTVSERIEIQVGVGRNESLRSMGRRLHRPASTIKRELDRNVENRYDGRASGYRRKEAFEPVKAASARRCVTTRWQVNGQPRGGRGAPRCASSPSLTRCVMRCRLGWSCVTVRAR